MHIVHQPPLPQRRLAGLGVTVLVHAALLLCWQLAEHLPAPQPDPPALAVQWLRLPPPRAAAPVVPVAPALPAPRQAPGPGRARPRVDEPTPATAVHEAPAPPSEAVAPPAPAAPAPGVLQRALRDAGKVDRALRKENRAYITAPLDSPQIRLRQGIQAAADLAPNKWYEAPKVEELVNNTGDGARRTRVITAGGTYCITEVSNRAPNSIDMINIWGKQRVTSCPKDETPAKAQEWRTARD